MKAFEVRIVGTAGLLMHRMPEDALPGGSDGDAPPKASKVNHGTPEEQAEKAAYRMDGPGSELYLPGEAIYMAMVKAATSFKVPGQRGKTYKDTVKGMLIVDPEYIGLGVSDYVIDSRNVRVNSSAARRYRPRLDEWSADFRMEVVDEDVLTTEATQAILEHAGKTVGLLDFRPRFGRFRVESFREASC